MVMLVCVMATARKWPEYNYNCTPQTVRECNVEKEVTIEATTYEFLEGIVKYCILSSKKINFILYSDKYYCTVVLMGGM